MKEGDESIKGFMIELNRQWEEVFGHSYTQCYQLSLFDGEIGELHRKHLEFASRNGKNGEVVGKDG